MKLINIKKELDLKKVENYKEILDPNYIYLPINISKSKVYKGEIIGNYTISISGRVNNNIIENDFMEDIKPLDKEFINKYFSKYNDIANKDMIYINAIDKDPYCYNRYYILKNNMDIINDAIEYLLDKFNIKKATIVLTSSLAEFISKLKASTTYNNIIFKVVDDLYPIGFNKVLKDKLNIENEKLIINVEDLLDIYSLTKKKIFNTEKYITINGNLIKKPIVLKVKLYTKLNDYLKFLSVTSKNLIILNNSLCGKLVTSEYIVTRESDLFIISKLKKNNVDLCTNCGLCYRVCPVMINPLKKSSKCIKCGLCNYICPSKINCLKVGNNND